MKKTDDTIMKLQERLISIRKELGCNNDNSSILDSVTKVHKGEIVVSTLGLHELLGKPDRYHSAWWSRKTEKVNSVITGELNKYTTIRETCVDNNGLKEVEYYYIDLDYALLLLSADNTPKSYLIQLYLGLSERLLTRTGFLNHNTKFTDLYRQVLELRKKSDVTNRELWYSISLDVCNEISKFVNIKASRAEAYFTKIYTKAIEMSNVTSIDIVPIDFVENVLNIAQDELISDESLCYRLDELRFVTSPEGLFEYLTTISNKVLIDLLSKKFNVDMTNYVTEIFQNGETL